MYRNRQKRIGLSKISSIVSADVYKKERQKQIGGYIYKPEYSNDETAVYINDNMKSIIIASRGTKTKEDIVTDISLISGSLKDTARLKQLNELIQRLRTIYKNYHITTTGHSLGGSLSRDSQSDLQHTFNEGFSIPDFLNEKQKQHIIHRTSNDPASVLAYNRANETIESDPRYNPHTIKQFADLQTV
jgi:hypothetical protein